MYQNISLSYRSIGSIIRDYFKQCFDENQDKNNHLFIGDYKIVDCYFLQFFFKFLLKHLDRLKDFWNS